MEEASVGTSGAVDGAQAATPATVWWARGGWWTWVRENRSKALFIATAAALSVTAAALIYRRRRTARTGHRKKASAPPSDEEQEEDKTPRLDFAEVLPEELSLHIFYRCRAEDFLRAAQVSKEWNRLCDDDTIWREIYQRKWRKVASMLSLKTQARQRSTWKTLYLERDRVEKAYFNIERCPPEMLANESMQADFLLKEAKEIYYNIADSSPEDQLGKVSYAIAILAIAGEKYEGLHVKDPSNDQVLWSWGSALSLQATWTSELLSAIKSDEGEKPPPVWDHTNWLYRLAREKYEQALALVPPTQDGLYKHMMFADYCAELGNKRSGEEGQEYLAKARTYYQRVIDRAQAVQHRRHVKTSDGKDTIEVDTYQDVSAIARAHRGIGSSCLYGADKIYEAINAARSARANKGKSKATSKEDIDGDVHADSQESEQEEEREAENVEEQEKKEKENLEKLMEILTVGREHLIACVKLEPDQLEHLIALGDVLTMMAEMHEDPEESEAYFNEGVTNFERALTIDESDDALNEFAILLTKRAQRILKLIKSEGLENLPGDAHTASTETAVDTTATSDSSEPTSQGEESSSSEQHETDTSEGAPAEGTDVNVDPETARRLARRAELLAKANRYFDEAKAKFVQLENNSVWFGAINLACLAALRGQEDEAKQWLYTCRDRNDLAPEHLEDRDFDAFREREWFVELGDHLKKQREERQRQLEEEREREAEERRRMQLEAVVLPALTGDENGHEEQP